MNGQPTKPDCYQCRWMTDLPGDNHKCCMHPDAAPTIKGKRFNHYDYMQARSTAWQALAIEGNDGFEVAARFLWPVDFDPVWLKACKGFEPSLAYDPLAGDEDD